LSLGISPPEYRELAKSDAIYSYAAFFTQDAYISRGEPIGRVDGIYGRKNAKEECAKEVLRHLRDYRANIDADSYDQWLANSRGVWQKDMDLS
jgi:hypothetical protein